ncbi:hypothetical protein PIB30_108329 [Stylosanthes scabra]|uniref:Uncharacterized protein n=1 Tax=Stylosanthes scabra TaxID=79078 RepID=A0ABU6T0X4_9FABA|nr:hypothetical protein [Stylosanthes scabra]
MPRMKKTQKRSREGESSVEPPLSSHPLAKWFHANEDLFFYELRLTGRKEIPPRIKGKDTSGGIGYLCLWSRIFNFLGIDVSNENMKHVSPKWSEINESTLRHMGRAKGAQEEEQAPHMAFRGYPGSSSQEQPSMSDLMQVLQSIEQNMDQRFQRIEDNQTRMDRRLQRMERQMGIQEDEDEDQE